MQTYTRAERKLAARALPPLPPSRTIRVVQKNNPKSGFGPSSPNFPRVANKGSGGALTEDISFDEFVADINGSVAFTATKFPVQPGLVGTFPKGSVKAALYSEWKMVKCQFYYKPEVSGFATQGQSGKVILAMDYNAGNPAPTTKQQVEIMHRVDDMPYERMALQLDAAGVNRSDSKYIRTGPIPVDEDIKTFDGGNLWVCTIGQANGNLVGELHVNYTFRCSKPTLLNPAQGGIIANVTVALFTSTSPEAAAATTVAKQLLFATTKANGLGVVNTAGSMVPPAGNYVLDVDVEGENTGNNSAAMILDIQKNGVTIFQNPVSVSGANNTFQNMALHASSFVTANGTDAFTVLVTDDYSAGTETNIGTVRWVAV